MVKTHVKNVRAKKIAFVVVLLRGFHFRGFGISRNRSVLF